MRDERVLSDLCDRVSAIEFVIEVMMAMFLARLTASDDSNEFKLDLLARAIQLRPGQLMSVEALSAREQGLRRHLTKIVQNVDVRENEIRASIAQRRESQQ